MYTGPGLYQVKKKRADDFTISYISQLSYQNIDNIWEPVSQLGISPQVGKIQHEEIFYPGLILIIDVVEQRSANAIEPQRVNVYYLSPHFSLVRCFVMNKNNLKWLVKKDNK
jgi:hypothetical protein